MIIGFGLIPFHQYWQNWHMSVVGHGPSVSISICRDSISTCLLLSGGSFLPDNIFTFVDAYDIEFLIKILTVFILFFLK